MGLSADHIALIETVLSAADADDGAVSTLRKGIAGLTLTRCDTSDVDNEKPFREFKRFNVYLVDTSDHCWTITTDSAKATGLVVATNKVV